MEGQESGTVLFVRGADRSGGATEGSGIADPFAINGYTEQLADIRNPTVFGNTVNASRNHSWFELASMLVSNGFAVEQTTESVESSAPSSGPTDGAPVDFGNGFQASTFSDLNTNNGFTRTRSLADYDVVVFGSNNAVYTTSQINAVDDYIRNGGGAVFISDANFGSERGDAQQSDQQFLDRFGIVVNRDGRTYFLSESNGDFPNPGSPVLDGVDSFAGEGVSPFTVPDTLPSDVSAEILAQVPSNQDVRRPDGTFSDSTLQDAALVALKAGDGRIVGHFDRNTFFNVGGAGSNISVRDNGRLALNIFTYAANIPEPSSLMLLSGIAACLLCRRRYEVLRLAHGVN